MAHALETPLAPLVREFRDLQARGQSFVLATIIATEGSTYRKAGTQLLIAPGLEPRGLLSGGCLEADLAEHAREVLASGRSRTAAYDMRDAQDPLFGIGSGCEGAMQVLLQRVGPDVGWQPLEAMAGCVEARAPGAVALLTTGPAAGSAWWPGGGNAPWPEPGIVSHARAAAAGGADPRRIDFTACCEPHTALAFSVQPPPLLLLCGAGTDAQPLARHALALGLAVTVCDHRPALVTAQRFPGSRLRCQPAAEFARLPDLEDCAAAVVMSHHLDADREYLAAFAGRPQVDYVGLLGPAPRRDRLLSALGPGAAQLSGRLHAPVGLDIGARTPEAIALAIAGELHAHFAGRRGGPWNSGAGSLPA